MNSPLQITFDKSQIEAMLVGLQDFEKDKAIRDGLKKGGLVFEQKGKARLKQRMKKKQGVTGNLLNSFKVRVKRSKLGMLVGFTKKGSHAHLVDQGTEDRSYKDKSGQTHYTGSMKGNAFWIDTEALDYQDAMTKIYEGMEKSINKIMSRR